MDADELIIKLQWGLFEFTKFSKPSSITMNEEDLLMLECQFFNGTRGYLTEGKLRTFQGVTVLTTPDLPRGNFSIGIIN